MTIFSRALDSRLEQQKPRQQKAVALDWHQAMSPGTVALGTAEKQLSRLRNGDHDEEKRLSEDHPRRQALAQVLSWDETDLIRALTTSLSMRTLVVAHGHSAEIIAAIERQAALMNDLEVEVMINPDTDELERCLKRAHRPILVAVEGHPPRGASRDDGVPVTHVGTVAGNEVFLTEFPDLLEPPPPSPSELATDDKVHGLLLPLPAGTRIGSWSHPSDGPEPRPWIAEHAVVRVAGTKRKPIHIVKLRDWLHLVAPGVLYFDSPAEAASYARLQSWIHYEASLAPGTAPNPAARSVRALIRTREGLRHVGMTDQEVAELARYHPVVSLIPRAVEFTRDLERMAERTNPFRQNPSPRWQPLLAEAEQFGIRLSVPQRAPTRLEDHYAERAHDDRCLRLSGGFKPAGNPPPEVLSVLAELSSRAFLDPCDQELLFLPQMLANARMSVTASSNAAMSLGVADLLNGWMVVFRCFRFEDEEPEDIKTHGLPMDGGHVGGSQVLDGGNVWLEFAIREAPRLRRLPGLHHGPVQAPD